MNYSLRKLQRFLNVIEIFNIGRLVEFHVSQVRFDH